MPEKSRATLPREVTDHRERTELTETGPSDPQRFAERFDPFHGPYLADPYPFFAEGRAATPVFVFRHRQRAARPEPPCERPFWWSSNASRDGRHSEMETSGSSILDGGE